MDFLGGHDRHVGRLGRAARVWPGRIVAVTLLAVCATLVAGTAAATTTSPNAKPGPRRDKLAPKPPRKLTVSGSTQTSVSLSWTASTDNVGVTGYGIYLNGVPVGSTVSLTYDLSGLTCGTTYAIEVDAYDAAGNRSIQSAVMGATSVCPDSDPPSAPTGLMQLAAGATGVVLGWTPSSDNVGVAGYDVFADGLPAGTTGEAGFALSGLTCGGVVYVIAVDAFDAAGNHSATATLIVATSACPDTQAPSVPTGLVQTASTGTSITLSWAPSTDNVGVAGYGVYNGAASSGATNDPKYTVTGLACGTGYALAVDAFDAAGNRSDKAYLSATTSACAPSPPQPSSSDTQPPSTPSVFSVTGSTQTSISVAWTASIDNVGVAGYGVYLDGALAGSTAQTSYTFAGVWCGTSHILEVDAYDAAGNRSARTAMVAATAACPDTQPPTIPANLTQAGRTSTSITLSWTASSDNIGVLGYGTYQAGSRIGSTALTSYTFTGLSCGMSYTLGIDAYDSAGNRSSQATVLVATSACPTSDTTPPSSPTGLAAANLIQTSISLSWSASTDNVGVTGYGVYNGAARVGNTSSTSYTVSGLACGTDYTLAVDAYDAAGNRSAKTSIVVSTAACSSGSGSLYVSPSGSDANACAQSAPCASFDRAYHAAQPGQTVTLAGGSYGAQTLTPDASKSSVIVFLPTAGANVTVSDLTVDGADHLEFDSMTITNGWAVNQGSSDVTFRAVEAANFYITSASSISVIGGSYGPQLDNDDAQVRPACATCPVPTGILIDGVYLHDATNSPNSGAHTECIQVAEVDGLTIRNSKFHNCEHHFAFISPWWGGAEKNVVLENNFGSKVISGFYGFRVAAGNESCGAISFRYNSTDSPSVIECGTVTGTVKLVGNAGPYNSASCDVRYLFSHNVWVGAACNSSDKNVASIGYADANNGDLHLLSTSPAIDRGDTADYLPKDIDGQSRPMGSAPDAGADESR
jgi:chitodextrinase